MPKAVHVSVVDADVAGSLLKVVKGVYAPAVLRNDAWPKSVKDELSAHTHRYLATLTERAHELRGETVLYVPEEPSLLFLTTVPRHTGDTSVNDTSTQTSRLKKKSSAPRATRSSRGDWRASSFTGRGRSGKSCARRTAARAAPTATAAAARTRRGGTSRTKL
jgi:hypothetical protein